MMNCAERYYVVLVGITELFVRHIHESRKWTRSEVGNLFG